MSKWTENLGTATTELGDRVKELVKEGNARRLVIYKPSGNKLTEVSLTAGVVAGSFAVVVAPIATLIVASAALIAKVRLEVTPKQNGVSDSDEHPA